MGVVTNLRHSGLARAGLVGLLVLAYLVYLAGRLLQWGLDRLLAEPPVVAVVVPTVVLVVALVVVDRFFRPPAT